MTGPDDKRATRRSERLQPSCPEAAAASPPARRTRRAEAPAPPREHEPSVPAARAARSPSPPRREPEPEEGATAAPPPARRAEAPVPPPKREGSVPADWPRSAAYVLRSRHVPDTSSREPYVPALHEKRKESCSSRKELEHGRSCSSRKKHKQYELLQDPDCARMGLEHYNINNQVLIYLSL